MAKEQLTKKGPQTITTKDYDLFVPLPFNRDITKTKRLTESMKKHGFDEGSAINCRRRMDGRLDVVQGHHRLEVAKALGLSVVAIISESGVPVWALELGTHPWNMVDYVNGFAREGRPDYIEAVKYKEETGISTSSVISILTGGTDEGSHHTEMAKQGRFCVKHREYGNRVKELVEQMKSLGLDMATTRYFLKALRKCMLVDRWSDARWMAKIASHAAIMERQPDVDRYIDIIEKIYNRHTKKDEQIPLAFLARKLARKKWNGK